MIELSRKLIFGGSLHVCAHPSFTVGLSVCIGGESAEVSHRNTTRNRNLATLANGMSPGPNHAGYDRCSAAAVLPASELAFHRCATSIWLMINLQPCSLTVHAIAPARDVDSKAAHMGGNRERCRLSAAPA